MAIRLFLPNFAIRPGNIFQKTMGIYEENGKNTFFRRKHFPKKAFSVP
jgi:hypothetical protein